MKKKRIVPPSNPNETDSSNSHPLNQTAAVGASKTTEKPPIITPATETQPVNGAVTTDLADLAKFRLPQDFTAATTKRLLTTVPVRRPSKEAFFRTHPDPAFQFNTMLLELKDDSRDTYLVKRELWQELAGEPAVAPKLLITAVTKQGTLTLWPIRIPGSDGRIDYWNASALEAAEIAKTKWIRLVSDRALGAYVPHEAIEQNGEPKWPGETFDQIIKIAFRNRVIDSLDHPVLRRLRGEA